MTIDYVISSGTVTWLEHLQTLSWWEWPLMIVCAAFGGVFLGAFCALPLAFQDEYHQSEDREGVLIVLIMLGIGVFLFFAMNWQEAQNESPEGWQANIAQPYYDSLPLISKNIDIISVAGTNDPELFEITYSEKNKTGSMMNETVIAKFVKETGRTTIAYEYKEIYAAKKNCYRYNHI